MRSSFLAREIASFGVVGAFNYVLDVGLFNVLVLGPLGDSPLLAKTISTFVGVVSAYFMNRHWVFAHRRGAGGPRAFAIFAGLNVVALGISLGCLAFSEYVVQQHGLATRNLAGNVVGAGLAMVFRFWSYKRLVFLEPALQDRSASATN